MITKDLPAGTLAELTHWIEAGKVPDAFCRALLRNDLIECVKRGSPIQLQYLINLTEWLIENAPEGSYGSARVFSDYPMYLKALERQAEEAARMEGVSL